MTDPIRSALMSAIEARGGRVDKELDGDRLRVELGGKSFEVYLDNLRRRVDMGDRLDVAVSEFIDALAAPRPEIDVATRRSGLRLMLEQAAVLSGTKTLHRSVSPEVAISLVWMDDREGRIRLMQPQVLAAWQLDEEDAWASAADNMNRLLAESPLKVMDGNRGLRLGMLETNSVLKASLISAPALRVHVEPELGWPVFAVAPCRDFLYLVPDSAKDQLGRIGAVVVREFTQSAYPLSPEIFQISDAGIRSIARFQSNTNGP